MAAGKDAHNRKKPLKHNKGTQYKHVKKLTSPAPAISTRSHPCTASHPESDELTRGKTQIRIFQSSSLLKRHPIARQLDEGKTQMRIFQSLSLLNRHPIARQLDEGKNTQMRIFQSLSLLTRNHLTQQIDEGRTRKYGSSSHYRHWTQNTVAEPGTCIRNNVSDGIAGKSRKNATTKNTCTELANVFNRTSNSTHSP